ncbi:MAG TPA: hypothetical protein VN645_05885 [Steroidobacteraceae bacterium]|nr:hypothetical protein [Steroidobacteraceae bacterium]
MSHSRIRMYRATLFASIMALLPLSQAAAGAETRKPKDDLASTVANTTAEMDEIVVSGRLDKLSEVKKAIVAAEDRAYARYNELNKSRMYDITCILDAPIGTRLKSRNCEAGYVTDGKAEAIHDLLEGHAGNLRPTADIINTHLGEMQRRMREIAQSDPEMLRALVERSLLVERYDMLKKKKFDGHKIVWD